MIRNKTNQNKWNLTIYYSPKRTIRVVLFANEENGLRGGTKYAEEAILNNEKHFFALESDAGGFTPRGFSFDTSEKEFKTIKKFEVHKIYSKNRGIDWMLTKRVSTLEKIGILDSKKEALRLRNKKFSGEKLNSDPSPAIEKNSGKQRLIK